MVSQDKITTIKLHQSIRDKLKDLKIYPHETNEEILIRLIKKEILK